jgi:hypothetical protein
MAALSNLVNALPAVGLEELNERADLQIRSDRKYVINAEDAELALRRVADQHVALEVDQRRRFLYESLYFDTPDHLSYRLTATQRPGRFKVRTRRYVGQQLCMLEVKTEGGREQTVKQRLDYQDDNYDTLTDDGRQFVDSIIGSGVSELLVPTVMTAYHRSTLLNTGDNSRVTIDAEFACAGHQQPWQTVGSKLIVETKTSGRPSSVDRALWAMGLRPERMSKFGVATAILDPVRKANRWNRVLRRDFDWLPERAA